jgi:hypothetical protein
MDIIGNVAVHKSENEWDEFAQVLRVFIEQGSLAVQFVLRDGETNIDIIHEYVYAPGQWLTFELVRKYVEYERNARRRRPRPTRYARGQAQHRKGRAGHGRAG